jgi:peptidoglycan/xylan/chitin deacetylase (PgdA/CDA1 family)
MNKTHLIRYGIFVILAVAAVLIGLWFGSRPEEGKPCLIPILMYHEVGKTADSPWCVPLETFRSQMVSLREQGFKTILPSDIAAYLQSGKSLPRQPVIITFDDGYLSNLATVEPILKENGLRAIIYLITDRVSEKESERRKYEGKECLTWPEVTAMQKRRTFVFGGHAHTHKNLAGEANPSGEIAECRRQLLAHDIKEPYSFCYPHGQYNDGTIEAVRQAGFQTAMVCEDNIVTIGPKTDLFALPRVSVMGGNHEFKLLNKASEANEKTLVYRLMHNGIPIEISARLRGKDRNQEVWLPVREVFRGEFELRFVLPDNVTAPEYNTLEIWDKHRLFKLSTINL